jgi:glycosyltransferase involved in cell wall biosynthesis
VPVVLGEAGPAEIVEPGVSGLYFRDLTDLTEQTRRLIADPDELARLARGARQRAEHFGLDAFADRLEAILARSGS